VNHADLTRWLKPSPPIAVDDTEPPPPKHEFRVRDRRARFGDPEVYAAECSCGWVSERTVGDSPTVAPAETASRTWRTRSPTDTAAGRARSFRATDGYPFKKAGPMTAEASGAQ
jgi:hypothetical protein